MALWSEGSRERMAHMLNDHKLHNITLVESWPTALAVPHIETALAVLGLESGFETADVAVITEQDILGDRLVRPRRANRKLDNFISEVTSLVRGRSRRPRRSRHRPLHRVADHRVSAARRMIASNCAMPGTTKLFLPVENIELLSRYGSEQTGVELDRLGGGGWQARKAKLKNRIREIAGDLIRIAAERHLHEAPKLDVAAGRL